MIEKRTTDRVNKQAGVATRSISSGNSKTMRDSITATVKTISLPPKVTHVILHNAGSNPIKITINADSTDFFTIPAGVILPKIAVNRSIIKAVAQSGSSVLEYIFEG